jgi:putative membrane protein
MLKRSPAAPVVTRLNSENLRVFLAAERTLLAWIRTGLALMGFGFLVSKFGVFLREWAAVREVQPDSPPAWSLWLGTAILALGIAVNFLAALQHLRLVRMLLPPGSAPSGRSAMAVTVAFASAILGLLMAVYLVITH